MPTFQTADGGVTLELGDDVEIQFADPTTEAGMRIQTGQVTSLRPEENAVWIRGVRVDLEGAHVVHKIDSESPENLRRAPER